MYALCADAWTAAFKRKVGIAPLAAPTHPPVPSSGPAGAAQAEAGAAPPSQGSHAVQGAAPAEVGESAGLTSGPGGAPPSGTAPSGRGPPWQLGSEPQAEPRAPPGSAAPQPEADGVQVLQADFLSALAHLTPSLSLVELAKYERLRDQYQNRPAK